MKDEYNNGFYGYNGYINRKNYAINLFILVALYVSTNLVNWNSFTQFTSHKFLSDVLLYIILCFQFIMVLCLLSVVYRRISDIIKNKTEKTKDNAKTFFIVLYVIPVLYFLALRQFINFYILDILVLLLILISAISSIVLCFIKSK